MTIDLTRTLRPQSLAEVLGQQHLKPALERSLEKQACGAYLFHGESGTGKTTLARIVADAQCDAPDVTEIDAASHSGVEDARGLAQTIAYAPTGKGKRAIIMDECHRLSKPAWEVLLKPVEEPHPRMLWIFCTTDIAKVPKAIQNRCEKYTTKPVDPDEIAEYVRKVAKPNGIKLMKGVSDLIAEQCEGAPRQAVRWLGMVDGLKRSEAATLIERDSGSEEAIALCRLLVKGNFSWPKLMELVNKIEDDPETVRNIIVAYFEKVAGGSKSFAAAQPALAVLDAFREPYPAGKRKYPIILSLGELIDG